MNAHWQYTLLLMAMCATMWYYAIDGLVQNVEVTQAIRNDERRLQAAEHAREEEHLAHLGLARQLREVVAERREALPHVERLQLGMTAPEIVGKDIDGNDMKLSDFKGKVTVLDFWGFW